MSEIIKRIKNPHDPRHCINVVQNRAGQCFYVSSRFTADAGYETMVFLYDGAADEVVSWLELYRKNYRTLNDMVKGHVAVCQDIDSYLDEYLEERMKHDK